MISEKIQHLRRQKGLSQTELANLLGVTRSAVNSWEQGTSFPSTSSIVRISNIFKVSTDYILKPDSKEAVIFVEGLSPKQVGMVQEIANEYRMLNKAERR